MSVKSQLAAKRNWGRGRLASIVNNLGTFTSTNACTTKEAAQIYKALKVLRKVQDNYTTSSQQLGLKK